MQKKAAHLWEGSPTSVDKHLPEYLNETPNLISEKIISKEIAPVYQLVRIAFYAMKLGAGFLNPETVLTCQRLQGVD